MSTPWIVAFVALWAVVLFVGTLVLGLLRRVSPVLEQTEARLISLPALTTGGLPPGTPAPEARVRSDDGSEVDLPLSGEPWVALFLSSECRPCEALVEELRTRRFEPDVTLVLVVDSPGGRERVEGLPFVVLHQRGSELTRAFEIFGTPHAVVIDHRGTVIENAVPTSVAQLAVLARRAEGGEVQRTEIAELTS